MDPNENIQNPESIDVNPEELAEKSVASSAQSGAISVMGSEPNRKLAKGEVSTFDATDEISEEGAKVLKEKAQEVSSKIGDEQLPNFHTGEGINLLPTQTTEEIRVERRKTSVNLFSAIAILIVVFFSVIILGINVSMKIWLNQEKKQLTNLENQLLSESEVIRANNDINRRFDLYSSVQEGTFSPKEVLLYWRNLVSDFGQLDAIELQNGLNFGLDGKSDNLKQIAFLWHLMTIDEKVTKNNLESFSKGENLARFAFKGTLDFEYFANKAAEEREKEQEEIENELADEENKTDE